MISQSRRAGRASSPTAGRNPAVIAPGRDRLRVGDAPRGGIIEPGSERTTPPIAAPALQLRGRRGRCRVRDRPRNRIPGFARRNFLLPRPRRPGTRIQAVSPARRRRGRNPGLQAVPCPGGSTQLDPRLRSVAPVRRGQAPPLPAFQRTGPGFSCLGAMKLPTPPPRLNPGAAVSDPDPVTAPGCAADVPGVTRTAPRPRAKGCRAARSWPEPLPWPPRLADPEPGRPSRIRVEPAGEGDIS